MNDKEYQEIKKDWTDDRIAYLTMQLLQTRPVSIIQQLIAYVEELDDVGRYRICRQDKQTHKTNDGCQDWTKK